MKNNRKNIYPQRKVEFMIQEYLERNNIFVERTKKNDFYLDVWLEVACEVANKQDNQIRHISRHDLEGE